MNAEDRARLDQALPQRGLARSRSHAAELIAAGLVRVDGRPVSKASFRVPAEARIEVDGGDHYVSRAAHKLLAGLDAFGLDVTGRLCLDVGASTGGFTQVLLEREALEVLAIDVGHGQLSPLLEADPRVRLAEGFNARNMTPETLAAATGQAASPTLVVGDLSFISLPLVLPALVASAAEGADFVLLIKPQFEVGRTGIREGIVHDPDRRADAVAGVLWAAWDLGLGTCGLIESPIAGGNGNREYVAHLRAAHGENPSSWRDTVNELTRGTA
ncbi:TlyA family RNA methyltransferase [Leucobacter sp. M11]|uniref:TlyA family RNA methyltransferase n=1 Tax=Leucobacter sp. M11 TaxID=2993565 RepID=UPI002D80FFC0|nr:TlyA family RNA methyltransferase [Leucobacter sp. M11]MEB4613815.1 TlyA family RNA methyltransferase [Leucobacter sp. M11]